MSAVEPVRLYHPMVPDGREFDPVTAETMRRQGWTAKAPATAQAPAPVDSTNTSNVMPGPGSEGTTNQEATHG